MDLQTVVNFGSMVIQVAIIPLVVSYWQMNGRLSRIEGQLEVIIKGKEA